MIKTIQERDKSAPQTIDDYVTASFIAGDMDGRAAWSIVITLAEWIATIRHAAFAAGVQEGTARSELRID